MGREQYLEIRYEDLIRSPGTVVPELFAFAGVGGVEDALRYCSENVSAGGLGNWRKRFGEEQLREIEPIVRPIMEELGYAWD